MPGLVLSLFPGLGLLDAAFEAEGFTVVRGPDVLWGGDVRRFHPPAGRFDAIIGGPPCQSFSSLANLVRARGHAPKFGNLIPEFARCVAEAAPAWFLMENVRQAPEPAVDGYAVRSFLFDFASLDAGDGFGQGQRRLRRFTFGRRGAAAAPDLRRWIEPACFERPGATRTLTQHLPDNSAGAKCGRGRLQKDNAHRGTGKAGGRFSLADALRLQGLPPDYLKHAPFTAAGALAAVANGVPLPMGRALARAVVEALQLPGD